MINAIGNLGGFAGPYLVGLGRAATNDFTARLLVLGGALVLAGSVAIAIRHDRTLESGP